MKYQFNEQCATTRWVLVRLMSASNAEVDGNGTCVSLTVNGNEIDDPLGFMGNLVADAHVNSDVHHADEISETVEVLDYLAGTISKVADQYRK